MLKHLIKQEKENRLALNKMRSKVESVLDEGDSDISQHGSEDTFLTEDRYSTSQLGISEEQYLKEEEMYQSECQLELRNNSVKTQNIDLSTLINQPIQKIFEDPMSYGKQTTKFKRFKTKYTEELKDKDLPPPERHARLELTSNDYLKLYMQNNPIHDGDRENAMSIVKNIVPFNK